MITILRDTPQRDEWLQDPYTEYVRRNVSDSMAAALHHLMRVAVSSTDPAVTAAFARYEELTRIHDALSRKQIIEEE